MYWEKVEKALNYTASFWSLSERGLDRFDKWVIEDKSRFESVGENFMREVLWHMTSTREEISIPELRVMYRTLLDRKEDIKSDVKGRLRHVLYVLLMIAKHRISEHEEIGVWNSIYGDEGTEISDVAIDTLLRYSDLSDKDDKDIINSTVVPLCVKMLLSQDSLTAIDAVKQLRQAVFSAIKDIYNQNYFQNSDVTKLLFLWQILCMIFCIITEGKYSDYAEWIALSYTISCLRKDDADSVDVSLMYGIRLYGLNVLGKGNRCAAINCLSSYAEVNGEYQVAYDTAYSYITQKNVGVIAEYQLFFLDWDDATKVINPSFEGWAEESISPVLDEDAAERMVYDTFLQLCRRIGLSYEAGSEGFSTFLSLTIDCCKKHSVWDGGFQISESVCCLARGSLLLGKNRDAIVQYDQAIDELQKSVACYEGTVSYFSETCYVALILVLYEKLVAFYFLRRGSFTDWIASDEVQNTIKQMNLYFNKMEAGYIEQYDFRFAGIESKVVSLIRRCFLAMAEGGKKAEQAQILLLINGVSEVLIESLKRNCYRKTLFFTRDPIADKRLLEAQTKLLDGPNEIIAYYTTLKNVSFLFDEMFEGDRDKRPREAKDEEKGINCLTVMHSRYMNDPYEGVALIKSMNSNGLFDLNHPEKYRESLLAEQHLFLKSFTNQIDKLTMWNRYASDYGSMGKNSNGCCVILNSETFDRMINNTYHSGYNDDYHLYRVIYVSEKGVIERKEKYKKSTVLAFSYLQKVFAEADRAIASITNTCDDCLLKPEMVLETMFGRLMFLVKDIAYEDECESRIVITRDLFSENIRLVGAKHDMAPQKLALNPYSQVFVDEIILGPNIKNREEWKPFLQYMMSKMWSKHPASKGKKQIEKNWVIRDSTIPYSTM